MDFFGMQKSDTSTGIVRGMNKYGLYAIPSNVLHRPAAKLVKDGQIFEPDTIEFLRLNHKNQDIVHAGTFFGDFLPGVSSAMTSGSGLIWAFEPNPNSYLCATRTIELNKLNNVVLYPVALSNESTTVRFQVVDQEGREMGGASRIAGANVREAKTVSVAARPIDEIVSPSRQVSILQLDLEGHEKQALRGAVQTINRCKPILILEEIFDASEIVDIVGHYEAVGTLHRNGVFVPSRD